MNKAMSEEQCIHWMNPEWCAICLQHDLGDEEEEIIFKGLLDKEVERK